MYVKELWRYPVKSLAGERLESVSVDELGLHGDRNVVVLGRGRRIKDARRYPKLLALKGTLGDDDRPRIDGFPWQSPEALELVRAAAGADSELVWVDGPERFDILPLSVATDGAIEFMNFDGRRLRPNIVVGGVEGLAERKWPGRQLQIGQAIVDTQKLRERCVMTTWHPDTQEQDITVLKRIVEELDGVMTLDTSVTRPGLVKVDDPVMLLER